MSAKYGLSREPSFKTWLIWKWRHSWALKKNVTYETNIISRNFMPFLIGACDIYAAPSRLEGFGMPQVEAGACRKPVIGIKAMGMLDTLVHGETAFLANCLLYTSPSPRD